MNIGESCKSIGHLHHLDQGPDGALKIIFLKYGLNFGMDKPRDLKFCKGLKHLKIFDICPGIYRNLDQGHDGVSKTVFRNMARTLGWMNLET